MGRRCSISECGKATGSMFRIPKNRERARKWILLIAHEELSNIPMKKLREYRVCERHFEIKRYRLKSKLTTSAIPTLHLPTTPIQRKDNQPINPTNKDHNVDREEYYIEYTALKDDETIHSSIHDQNMNVEDHYTDYLVLEDDDGTLID